MNKKVQETIIIGGGASGLACAHNLATKNRNFLLITENLGGRIMQCRNLKINYGAYYATNDYSNVKEFLSFGNRLSLTNSLFHEHNSTYKLINPKFILRFPQLFRLVIALRKFRKHYRVFQYKCENISQKQALKEDSYLYNLYREDAETYIKTLGIHPLVKDYMAKVIYGTAFLPLSQISAFTFLQFTLPLIVPTFDFQFELNKITQKFSNKILCDSVIRIKKETNGLFRIKTTKSTYTSKYLVVATPPDVSKKLLKLEKMKNGVSVHMYHIKGNLNDNSDKYNFHFFDENMPVLVIAKQYDKTYLVYTKNKNPKFSNYFLDWEIIKQHHWNPAFNLTGNELWDCEIEKNLYLIGDHNICGLEDSFVTGIYAANKICGF